MRRSVQWLVVVALATIGLAGCGRKSEATPQAASTAAEIKPIDVSTAAAIERRQPKTFEVTGSLIADDQVVVSSEVDGKIEQLTVDLGSPVRRGQEIARIATKEYQIRLDQAQAALRQARARLGIAGEEDRIDPEMTADVRQAKAALDDAKLRYERSEKLVETGDISRSRFDEARNALRGAEAKYQSAVDSVYNALALIQERKSEAEYARKKLGDAHVIAPIDGTVSVKNASSGEYVRTNAPIVTIVRTNPLRLSAEVPEKLVPSVKIGQKVRIEVDAFAGRVFAGVVARISPSLSEKARSLVAEATVDNSSGLLRPGFFARTQFTTDSIEPVVLVPFQSVVTITGLNKVYVIENGSALERQVKLGNRDGELIEILDGVKAGEKVATSNVDKLHSGAKVTAAE